MLGKINKVLKEKGFGFISVEGMEDIFFHRSGLKNRKFEELQEGDKVEFELQGASKGPRAEKVTVIV